MRKNHFTASLLALSIYLLAGCNSESTVEGEMFVVTQARSSIPLSGAVIYAVEESELTKIVLTKHEEKTNISRALNADRSEQMDSIMREAKEISHKLESLKTDLSKTANDIFDIASNDPEYYEMLNESRVARSVFEIADEVSKTPNVRTMSLTTKWNNSKDEYARLYREFSILEAKLNSIRPGVENALQEMIVTVPEIYAQIVESKNLSSPVAQMTTDKDGKFKGKLPQGNYYLVALEERRALRGMENYEWLVMINSESASNIQLSNHNMGSEEITKIVKGAMN
ncbi:MAG: hypothetical protein RBS10_01515 [Thauera propionica]|nr:hypothetical protein [Thauera propionica]